MAQCQSLDTSHRAFKGEMIVIPSKGHSGLVHKQSDIRIDLALTFHQKIEFTFMTVFDLNLKQLA